MNPPEREAELAIDLFDDARPPTNPPPTAAHDNSWAPTETVAPIALRVSMPTRFCHGSCH